MNDYASFGNLDRQNLIYIMQPLWLCLTASLFKTLNKEFGPRRFIARGSSMSIIDSGSLFCIFGNSILFNAVVVGPPSS